MPEQLEFDYDVELLRLAVLYYHVHGTIPSPDELLSVDEQWEANVMRMAQWWGYRRNNSDVPGVTLKGLLADKNVQVMLNGDSDDDKD